MIFIFLIIIIIIIIIINIIIIVRRAKGGTAPHGNQSSDAQPGGLIGSWNSRDESDSTVA